MYTCIARKRQDGLNAGEGAFRTRYAGKRLAVVGGMAKTDQIRKLERLGVKVSWVPTEGPGRPRGNRLAVEHVSRGRFDFVVLFIRSLSHGVCHDVKGVVRKINAAAGRRVTVCVESMTLNPEVIAGAFLAHAPDLRVSRPGDN